MRSIPKLLSQRGQKKLSRCFKMNVQMFEVHRCRIKISLHSLHHLSSSISYATVSWFLQQPRALLNCFQILNQDDLFQTAIQPGAYLIQRFFPHSLSIDRSLFFTCYPSVALIFTSFCSATYEFGLFQTTNRNTNSRVKPV